MSYCSASSSCLIVLPHLQLATRSFLGYAGFYRRFIKNFSKIARRIYRLLEKNATFDFDEVCVKTFEKLKSRLVLAPIMIVLDWNELFEIMCDASDFVI